jgi:hypothetical protein
MRFCTGDNSWMQRRVSTFLRCDLAITVTTVFDRVAGIQLKRPRQKS